MKKFDVVESWLGNVAFGHSKSENTNNSYRHFLGMFCEFVECTPQEILEEYEASDDREFKRKYAGFLRVFISQLMVNGYAVGSIGSITAAVRSFFKYNDLPLSYVPTARRKVTFHNRDITKQEVTAILEASKPRDKAFFCIMAQSGLRPVTLSSLRLRHVQPDLTNGTIPCKIEIPEQLAKGRYKAYFTFIGPESIRYLNAYLSTRPNADKNSYLFTNYGTEQPLSTKSISEIFRKTIDTLKDKGTIEFRDRETGKPATLRLYSLRKYFRKMSHQAGFEIVQFWMGHVVRQGQEEHYRPLDVEWHRKLYVEKAMPFLRFETATPSETDTIIQRQAEEMRAETSKLRMEMEEKLREKDAEITRLKERLNGLTLSSNQMQQLLKRIEKLEQAQK